MKMTFDIPTVRKTDVLVIGGGCAGIAAAVSAARHGAKVLLTDANGSLGGMATNGLVGPFMTCYDPQGKRQVIRGLIEEMIQRMVRRGGAIHPSECPAGSSYSAYRVPGHHNCTPFTVEAFRICAEEMCCEAGVELLYHVLFQSCCMSEDGSRIEGAVFATKAGLIRIDASTVIDCTGDGDVVLSSGAPCLYGDENGATQPASLFFLIDNIDQEKMEAALRDRWDNRFFETEIATETQEGRYHVPRTKVAIYQSSDGTWRVNMSRVALKNGCDPFEITDATVRARAQQDEILGVLRKYVPGCENARLLESANMLGQRETRRIDGVYTLTGDDIRSGKSFEDTVFLAGSSIDMHGGNNVKYIPAQGDAYPIPYRILLPKKVQNLLVAGRCASMDREALAAIRVMPPVFAMGQAAGTAAAIALQSQVCPADVDTALLQKTLLQDDVVLE